MKNAEPVKPLDTLTLEAVATGTTDQALLTDIAGVARMLSVSVRHAKALNSSGRLGPMAFSLGRSRRWRIAEIREWVSAAMPARAAWLGMQRGAGARAGGGR